MNLNAFFRSTKFRVLIGVLALLTGILIYSAKQGGHKDIVSRSLSFAVSPVRHFSAAISDDVDDTLDIYFKAKAYREENARLREQISTLNQELVGYDEAVAELKALRDLLKIKEKNPNFKTSEPCRIMSTLTNDLTGSFLIDQGEDDGLTLGAPVICSDGLVGVISAVTARTATVTTVLSPELSVGAVVLEANENGIVEGTLRLAEENRTKLIYLNKNTAVKRGDLVITAGTTGLFPYGLVIGNVTETGTEDTGLTDYAVIAPSVDLESLETVTVLLDFDGRGVSLP